MTVWCQLASMASQLGNLLLTRKSLEQALTCHSSYWPAIEGLCTVLYALGDFLCKRGRGEGGGGLREVEGGGGGLREGEGGWGKGRVVED